MSENTATALNENVQTDTVSLFGYELIREVLISEILGEDAPKILYWAGKNIARKYPLDTMTEIIDFFNQAGWGNLTILKEAKNELLTELSGPFIAKRIESKEQAVFQLEAGFLAQQIERQKKVITETFEHPRKRRSSKVQFTVKWDLTDEN